MAVKFNYFFAGVKQACKIDFQIVRTSCSLVKSIFKLCGRFAGLQNRFSNCAGILQSCKIDFQIARAFCRLVKSIFKLCRHFAGLFNRR